MISTYRQHFFINQCKNFRDFNIVQVVFSDFPDLNQIQFYITHYIPMFSLFPPYFMRLNTLASLFNPMWLHFIKISQLFHPCLSDTSMFPYPTNFLRFIPNSLAYIPISKIVYWPITILHLCHSVSNPARGLYHNYFILIPLQHPNLF